MNAPTSPARLDPFPDDVAIMRRALELAEQGRGAAEPNPMVGAVVVDDRRVPLGEGFHQRFGGPHAEIHALAAARDRARGQTLFVTLEPCCHFGKTGPCTQAILDAGVRRVIVGTVDPAPHVAGQGIAALRAAGVDVEVGLLESDCRWLIAPFVRRETTGMPWVHAKWAMTLDGKIASRTGASQWISNPEARQIVHALRGRMDAILVGAETARRDDPLLTARPPGPRTPVRVVVDSMASLSPSSQLARTASQAPVVVACGPDAPREARDALRRTGVEVMELPSTAADDGPATNAARRSVDLFALLKELARRSMTHLFVEGGSRILGNLFDQELIDEAHVFIAPKLIGGCEAASPIGGRGLPSIPERASLEGVEIRLLGDNVYLYGRLRR